MHSLEQVLKTARRAALTLALLVTAALVASPAAQASGPRPLFQMPFACGQTWEASTYDGHWPNQNSIDLAMREDDGNNISEGQPVLASAAGTVLEVGTDFSRRMSTVIPCSATMSSSTTAAGGRRTTSTSSSSRRSRVGQAVAQGEQIGRTFNSGADADAPALHAGRGRRPRSDRVQRNADLDEQGKRGVVRHLGQRRRRGADEPELPGELVHGVQPERHALPAAVQAGNRRHEDRAAGRGRDRRDDHVLGHVDEGLDALHALLPQRRQAARVHLQVLDRPREVPAARQPGQRHHDARDRHLGQGLDALRALQHRREPVLRRVQLATGSANIDRVNAEGNGATTVYQDAWIAGRTEIVPFTQGPNQYLLLYQGGSGAAKIVKITGSGNNIGVTTVWSDTWTTGWTSLVPLKHNGTVQFLAYKAASGKVKFLKANANGQGVQTLGETTWTKPWTAFSPLLDRRRRAHPRLQGTHRHRQGAEAERGRIQHEHDLDRLVDSRLGVGRAVLAGPPPNGGGPAFDGAAAVSAAPALRACGRGRRRRHRRRPGLERA